MSERVADVGTAPPLALWLVVLALSVLGALGLAAWVADEIPPEGLTPELAACARAWRAEPASPARGRTVLAVGTSLLFYGTGAPPVFESGLPGAAWRPCVLASGNWADLQALWPAIEQARPDVLLLHEGMLVPAPWLQTVGQVATAVSWRLKQGVGHPRPLRVWLDACPQGGPGPAIERAQVLAPLAQQDTRLAPMLKRLAAAGTRVVILDIPRDRAWEAAQAGPLAQRRAQLQRLAQASGAGLWAFDAPSGPASYCPDQSHLGEAGRVRFAAQLTQRLRQVLVDRQP